MSTTERTTSILARALAAVEDPAATARLEARLFRTPCTGLTAHWCPNHGDCSCPADEHSGVAEHLDHPACPLHSTSSDHPHSEEPTP